MFLAGKTWPKTPRKVRVKKASLFFVCESHNFHHGNHEIRPEFLLAGTTSKNSSSGIFLGWFKKKKSFQQGILFGIHSWSDMTQPKTSPPKKKICRVQWSGLFSDHQCVKYHHHIIIWSILGPEIMFRSSVFWFMNVPWDGTQVPSQASLSSEISPVFYLDRRKKAPQKEEISQNPWFLEDVDTKMISISVTCFPQKFKF